MPTREMVSWTRSEMAMAPQQLTGSLRGEIIDTAGCDSLTFEIPVGAVAAADASNRLDFKLESGTTPDLSDAADVAPDDMIVGADIAETAADFPSINSVEVANSVFRIGYRGFGRRYVRVAVDDTGAPSAFVAAVACKGHLSEAP